MVVKVIDFSKASASPLNPLSAKVRQFIWNELQEGSNDDNVTSMILTGGPVNFSAGADLTEFASFSSAVLNAEGGPPSLIDVVQALEGSNKPIVAAVAGACLGGGCELALACHYRVALSPARLGLPEVHVGVVPGAGGTQRLPKAVGLAAACRMILTGAPLGARAALKLKLVDDVVPDDMDSKELVAKAQKWAVWAEVMPLNDRRLGQKRLMEPPPVAHNILQQAELSLPKLGAAGFRAALRAIRASFLPLEQGMEVEKEAFLETLVSEQGKARRHAFFAVRQAQKLVHPELAKQIMQHPLLQNYGEKFLPTAVVGAGTMGTGIAIVLLQAGFHVTLVDVQEKALEKGVATIRQTIESQVQRKKLKPAVAESMIGRLHSTTELDDLGQCALAVEAVVENMQIKQQIFSALDRVTPSSCILASNTSTLDIDAMASVLRPERQKWFLGWHFFSPANIMKLVEVVRGARTCPEATTLLQLLSKKVGKIGVVVGNCDGFCGNRLLRPFSLESAYLVEEGSATIRDADQAVIDLGVALGPFGLGDLAGNDVGYNIRRERGWTRASGNENEVPPRRPARYSEVADIMVVDYGRVGQKAGKGWYDYDPAVGKGRVPLHSKEMETLIQNRIGNKRVPQLSPEEIVRRCYFPLVNEGFKCLEEGIALRPSDIDVVYLHGYGWPAWRGGPMHWADHQVGLPLILSWLQKMSKEHPTTDHFVPSSLLVECVQKGMTVEELCKQKEQMPDRQSSKL